GPTNPPPTRLRVGAILAWRTSQLRAGFVPNCAQDAAGAAQNSRGVTELSPDPHVEGFLALLAARRAPRTVDAYRRDLAQLASFLAKPPSSATPEDSERYIAALRADGLAPATVARRAAAVRSFFRHQQLLGTRTDNPAADLDLPRRRPKLPRTLSAGEAERLVEAAPGGQPRDLRDRALVEPLYAAGLRVPEAGSPASVGGRLAREGRRLPRRAARPLHREGRQGANRADRPPGGRGASPLPRPRQDPPRPAPPARALPQRPRRPAHARWRVPHSPQARRQ